MNISISDYRARIGNFNNRACCTVMCICVDISVVFNLAVNVSYVFFVLILVICGDIETNPGPVRNSLMKHSDTCMPENLHNL